MEQSITLQDDYAVEDMAPEAIKDGPKKYDEVEAFVRERFERAKDKKTADEERFLRSYRNFRGLYDPKEAFSDKERSKVFVKVTKTKVLAAYGQIVEVLFGNSEFPIAVDQTKLPDGISDAVNFDPQAPAGGEVKANETVSNPFGTRDGPPLPPGATAQTLLGGLTEKLAPIADKLQPGIGATPTSVTFHPAHVAGKKMEKKIKDQLDECGASKHLRHSAFECALFGTGIVKGPLAIDKEYPKWEDGGEYNPLVKTVPTLSHVSVWNFYPDPDAHNMDEVEYVVERHKMSRRDMQALKRRPLFRKEAIDDAIQCGSDYTREYWEMEMEDDATGDDIQRWEVLEYWGFVEARCLRDKGVHVDKKYNDDDMVQANIWTSRGEVLRCVINPFTPALIPYHAAPYELNPYSFFGIGVAENMEDTQLLMNGFMRMAVDNAALSGSLVFEVDEGNLTPGQDLEIYPGKVFRRQQGAPGQAIFATQFPNVAEQNLALFDKARFLADESTGLPSYAYGQTGIQNIGRTASGISMMMNAASGSIKTVVKNIDDYLLAPVGKAFFAFNMQFDHDKEIKGDLEVTAKGTESLMATEVRSQRLMQFLGLVSNPMFAPFVKLDVILRDIAKSLDLDPDRVTNSNAEAALQAEILKAMNVQPQGGTPQGAPAGADPMDPTGAGGGTIGTGQVPNPGEAGFSSNGGTGGTPATGTQ